MAAKAQPKKQVAEKAKQPVKTMSKTKPISPMKDSNSSKEPAGAAALPVEPEPEAKPKRPAMLTPDQQERYDSLHRMLMAKRQEILKEIGGSFGQSVTEDQQQRLESAKDVGDQALMDLEREVGISLMEMRNRKRQLIDEALGRLRDGLYGICAECGVEISERRLAVMPFAKLCVECQARQELLERIEKEEERD
ncbi:DnaK suppressor protein [Nitrospira tepida]|uniref:DnaK suppressor protein n=1 Tax=Nitrospira tepida TaxID=2973512 RepID=A0AA86MY62_9BACT|nr:TraR/DksA family transcriptional regulator [Nitrospira tepida]CAI4031172.1 DnaK suppressor protein [Nitrospira tepida]